MSVSKMIGKTMVSVKQINNERLEFVDTEGIEYALYHQQDCCESVYIEDVVGDLQHLVNAPLYMAEEAFSSDEPKDKEYPDESFTWTFYKFATVHGYVTIRFYGSSNGYYGETANLYINGDRVYEDARTN